MDNKDKLLEDILDANKGFSNLNKSNDNDWLIALIISSFFGSGFGSSDHKYNDLDKRLAKVEAKQDMIEKIILK